MFSDWYNDMEPDWDSDIPPSLLPSPSADSADTSGDTVSDEPLVQLTVQQVLDVLTHGRMDERGLLPYSSNYNFLIVVQRNGLELPAVYKPRRGETPLWDFPSGTLCLRETAAFVVSEALGWDLVPPTVLRKGTRGIGSVQFYVSNDPDQHYFTIREDARYAQSLRKICLFDYIVNNADRKSGHCIVGFDGKLWAIDHGICFHSDYKLRTVIWEFSGEPIEEALLADLEHLRTLLTKPSSYLCQQLEHLLSRVEERAVLARTEHLLDAGVYPAPLPYQRNYPWPPV
jgi:uncharacterized repeat protein (TIGR03843 family)